MKIRFYNLGQIKETELDLKPLTIIIGPNNTNKTYIAYSVYGLWQKLADYMLFGIIPLQDDVNGSCSIRLDTLRQVILTTTRLPVGEFTAELETFFQDSSHSLFSKTRYEVDISPEEFETALRLLPSEIDAGLDVSVEQDLLVLSPTDELVAFLRESRAKSRADYHIRFAYSLDVALRHQLYPQPYLLPAERNAFIITYKVLANRRLKLMLDAQRRSFSSRETSKRQLDLLREAGEVRYPQPVEDFLEFLFDVESEIKPAPAREGQTNGRRKGRRPAPNGIGKLAGEIERTIQNGNTLNFRTTALGGQEIRVDVGNGLNIDLYNASSSIKQLAPLLLYLRYRARKGDLLIIDEPEMNLHPESQAKLLEVLAMLVNQGVYVLLTTHSPYLMSHLNNLAQSEEASPAAKKRQAKSLYLTNPAALLNMDQISAYEMRDNQLHSLKDPDYGIRWDTLSDVSSDLQQRYFAIHE